MNLLELCQMAGRESGIISGNQPSSVLNQSGLLLKLVNWTVDGVEWVENQERAWKWMQKSWSGALTASNDTYTADSFSLTDFAEWIIDDHRRKYFPTTVYLTATGVSDEQRITFIPYEEWQVRYDQGEQTPARPTHYSISPQNEILFGPVPDDAYTVRGMYRRAPTRPVTTGSTANTQTPAWPARFHAAAAWEAARRMAAGDKAWDEALRCESERDDVMYGLRRDQLPPLRIRSRPLA